MAPISSNNHSDNVSSETEPIGPTKRLKISSWPSSAEKIAGNLDILIQILLCLPARSLVRFRSVSRQWRYLILGTRFPPEHISRNPKPSISGLYYKWDDYPMIHIPLQSPSLPTFKYTHKLSEYLVLNETNLRIHDSRHGLILCSYCLSYSTPLMIVCNPTTQKYNTFHQRELRLDRKTPSAHFYLYVDPSISPIYKVILIGDQGWHYEVSICASNRSFWKTLRLESQQQWGRLVIHGVLSSDGNIYMMSDKWYLVQFDVEKEKLSAALMTHEPKMPCDWIIGYFGERAGGNLVLIVSPKCGLDFMIYEMEIPNSRQWVLKHHIDLTQELHNLPEMHRPVRRSNFAVMWVCWDGENENRDLTIVLGVPEKVISYNHNSKEVKFLCDLPGRDSFDWETSYSHIHPFIGSLCAI